MQPPPCSAAPRIRAACQRLAHFELQFLDTLIQPYSHDFSIPEQLAARIFHTDCALRIEANMFMECILSDE